MAGGDWEPKHTVDGRAMGLCAPGLRSAVVAPGAACCGAGALGPARPRHDGVLEETQEQGGLTGEPQGGGMTRFSAGDCGKEAPQVPCAHASSQTTSLALGPLPPTQPSHSLSRARLRGVGPRCYGQPGVHPSALW